MAIVTGGYHESSDPNEDAAYDPDSLTGRAIAVIDMKSGALLAERAFDPAGDCDNPAWAVNSTPERKMCFAIPSTPAVYDADGDGYADVIYVGDLGGNLWKWVIKAPLELSDATTAAHDDADWPFRRVFSAPVYTDSGEDFYKSIYFPPAGTRKNGKIWIAFGTGERNDLLHMGDAGTDDDNNRFYVIEEVDLWEEASTPFPELAESDLSDLTNSNACSDLGGARGYFIAGAEGEKWVTNVEIFVGYVIVNSYVPQPSSDPCEIGGVAYLWAFRVECGEGLFTDGSGGPLRNLDIGKHEQLLVQYGMVRAAGLRYVYAGNLPGSVRNWENTYCPGCRALLVERVGYRILQNRVEGGVCPDCRAPIAGYWAPRPGGERGAP